MEWGHWGPRAPGGGGGQGAPLREKRAAGSRAVAAGCCGQQSPGPGSERRLTSRPPPTRGLEGGVTSSTHTVGVPVSVAQGSGWGEGGQDNQGAVGLAHRAWDPGRGKTPARILDLGPWHADPRAPAHREVRPVASPGDRARLGQKGFFCHPSAYPGISEGRRPGTPGKVPSGLPPPPCWPWPLAPQPSLVPWPWAPASGRHPAVHPPEARPASVAPPPHHCRPPGGEGRGGRPGTTHEPAGSAWALGCPTPARTQSRHGPEASRASRTEPHQLRKITQRAERTSTSAPVSLSEAEVARGCSSPGHLGTAPRQRTPEGTVSPWAWRGAAHPHQHGEDPRLVAEARGQPGRQLKVTGLGVRGVAPRIRPPALQWGHPVVAQLLPGHGAAGGQRLTLAAAALHSPRHHSFICDKITNFTSDHSEKTPKEVIFNNTYF